MDIQPVTLFHGTTLFHAELIVANGPDLAFVKPVAQAFFACYAHGPFAASGSPETYACLASRNNREHRGPAILVFDVPAYIVNMAIDDYFPRRAGFVAFEEGPKLIALQVAWANLKKRIIPFDCRKLISDFERKVIHHIA
jgi:hypothetical protein